MRKILNIGCLIISIALFISAAVAQEPVYWDDVAKIRKEGLNNSQVMDIVGYFSDVIGPRLTASPNMKNAQKWAEKKLEEIGLANVVIEKAGVHGVSWDNEYTSLHMIEPDYQPLLGYSKAFTPGTNGKVNAEAIIVNIKYESDFEQYKGKLKNKIILVAPPGKIVHHFSPDAIRLSEDDLEALTITNLERAVRPDNVTVARKEYDNLLEGKIPPREVTRTEVDNFLKAEEAAMIVDIGNGRGDDGTVKVMGRNGNRQDRSYEGALNALPEVAVAAEHYNRMYRILKRGIPVKLEMEIRNSLDNSDPNYYNVIAEIPGTDLSDEIVMIGGHLDSWHAGTGAVDNASGCAVAMEAARIIVASGLKPRRTIRVALWTFEEGGLHGSREYVNKHFGNPSMGTKPEYDKLSGYFNMDNGTGQFRGVWMQQNEAVRPIFEAWMEPFHDLGMKTLALRNTRGTDHLSFNRAGLNGWQFIQDRIDYGVRRHHTNMDVYDGLIPKDMKINSVIMASFAYHAAMRDELLPRKPYAVSVRPHR